MKHLYQHISIYLHDRFETICGTGIGLGAGIKQVAENPTQDINPEIILQKVLLVALYAIIGGIFGALGKWIIDEVKAYIKK